MSESTSTLPPHVQWLVPNRGPALLAALDEREGLDMSAHDAVACLASCDPSPGLHAVQWLCDTYLGGGYLWEDLQGGLDGKAGKTLALFAQHRHGLPRGLRRLEDHADLGGVYAAIAPALALLEADEDATPSARHLKRLERLRARGESIIIHESPELRLVVPTTRFAAQWWGRGTRWCTSATEHNMFYVYNHKAPLIIAVLPQTRFQLHLGNSRVQFMDEMDRDVSPDQLLQHQATLQPLIEWACTRHASMLTRLDVSARTPWLCRAAVELDGLALENVPVELRTPELCSVAVCRNPDAFVWVPPACQDSAMCTRALEKSVRNFYYVSDSLVTREMCLAAVARKPELLPHVPQRFLDDEIRMLAVSQDGAALHYIPRKDRSQALCMAAVASNPREMGVGLSHIPRRIRALFVEQAVLTDPAAFKLLLPNQITPQVVEAALDRHGAAMAHVPHRFLTPELCMQAVTRHKGSLKHVPSHMMTHELCLQAVRDHGESLEHVPLHMVNEQICRAAVESDPWALAHVRQRWNTPEVSRLALPGLHDKSSGYLRSRGLMRHLNPDVMTPRVCRLGILQEGTSLEYVPTHLRTRSLCTLAVQRSPRAIKWVPQEFQDETMWRLALGQRPAFSIEFMPVHMRHLWPATPQCELPASWGPAELDGLGEHVEQWVQSKHNGLFPQMQALATEGCGPAP